MALSADLNFAIYLPNELVEVFTKIDHWCTFSVDLELDPPNQKDLKSLESLWYGMKSGIKDWSVTIHNDLN